MPTPIELTLSSLLPTVGYIPPELISLSTSLLAQSRTKASSLKPEEEIARTYACCHIACQRLGHRLALEIGKPAPPVKPKVYNKLHTHLNVVLKTTSTSRTANASKNAEAQQAEDARKPTRGVDGLQTPTKARTTSATTTPMSRKRAATTAKQDEADVPEFAKPIIRLVCRSSDDPDAIPHVFAGVSSILSHLNYPSTTQPHSKRRKVRTDATPTSISEPSIRNLIIAVFVVVYSRIRGEWNIDEPDIADAAGRALRRYETGNPGAEFVYDDESEMMEEIGRFKKAARTTWGDMEWFQNVPIPERTMEEDIAAQDAEMAAKATGDDDEAVTPAKRPAKTPLRRKEKHGSVEDDDLGAAGLLPGLGTMFQPAVDWLSDERQEDYVRWKRDVLRQAAAVS